MSFNDSLKNFTDETGIMLEEEAKLFVEKNYAPESFVDFAVVWTVGFYKDNESFRCGLQSGKEILHEKYFPQWLNVFQNEF